MRLRRMWFLRAIETAEGHWACRHGTTEFDTHGELSQALDHLRELAVNFQPARLYVHRLDGSVETITG